jgi:hypothetical protein
MLAHRFNRKGDLLMETYLNNEETTNGGGSRRRRLGYSVAGLGAGSVLAYLLSRVLARTTESSISRHAAEHIVDDQGTNQEKAARILRNLRDSAFDMSDEKLALALGRPAEEVAAWNTGLEIIDDDVVMKARGIAMNRGVQVE